MAHQLMTILLITKWERYLWVFEAYEMSKKITTYRVNDGKHLENDLSNWYKQWKSNDFCLPVERLQIQMHVCNEWKKQNTAQFYFFPNLYKILNCKQTKNKKKTDQADAQLRRDQNTRIERQELAMIRENPKELNRKRNSFKHIWRAAKWNDMSTRLRFTRIKWH